MDSESIKSLLEGVKAGRVSIEQGLEDLRKLPFEDMDYAHLDHHRALRCGMSEVIYCPGKTAEQVVEIFERLAEQKHNVLATRADEETYRAVAARLREADFPLSGPAASD